MWLSCDPKPYTHERFINHSIAQALRALNYAQGNDIVIYYVLADKHECFAGITGNDIHRCQQGRSQHTAPCLFSIQLVDMHYNLIHITG